jgi:hypothetical protein
MFNNGRKNGFKKIVDEMGGGVFFNLLNAVFEKIAFEKYPKNQKRNQHERKEKQIIVGTLNYQIFKKRRGVRNERF